MTGIDEEHLRFAGEARTVVVGEELDQFERLDLGAVSSVDLAETSVGEDAADEGVVRRMVLTAVRPQRVLHLLDGQVGSYIDVEAERAEQVFDGRWNILIIPYSIGVGVIVFDKHFF